MPSVQVAAEASKPLPLPAVEVKPDGPKPAEVAQPAVPRPIQPVPNVEPRVDVEIHEQPVPLIDTAAVEDDGEPEEVMEITSGELDDLDDFDMGMGDFDNDRSGPYHGGRHLGYGGRRHRPHNRRPHHRRPHPRPGPGPHPGPGPYPTGRPYPRPTHRPHPHPTPSPRLGQLNGVFSDSQDSSLSAESQSSSQDSAESNEQSSSSSEEVAISKSGAGMAKALQHGASEPHKDLERERLEEFAMLKVHELRRTCWILAIILGWAMLIAVLCVCARICCCYLRHRRMGPGARCCKSGRCNGGAPYAVMVNATQSDRAPIIANEVMPSKEST